MSDKQVNHCDDLNYLIAKITDPLCEDVDKETLNSIVRLLNDNRENVLQSLRFFAHKIQSPNELEALKSLNVIAELIEHVDRKFIEEIGKFRFLNELIKVVSPKYLGNRTPNKIKEKVIELLFLWSVTIKSEPKIFEAYQMLKKQGIIDRDPSHILPPAACSTPPPPRPKNEIFDDEENSLKLQQLLHSRNREDLVAANRMIKLLVHESEKKSQLKNRCKTELEQVSANNRLLVDMLDHYQDGVSSTEELELINELYENCRRMRPSLLRYASSIDDKNPLFNEILEANEELTQTITYYRRIFERENQQQTCENNILLADIDSTPVAMVNNGRQFGHNELVDLIYDSGDDILLNLNSNNENTTQKNEPNIANGHDDFLSNDLSCKISSPQKTEPKESSSNQSSMSCLNELEQLMKQSLNVTSNKKEEHKLSLNQMRVSDEIAKSLDPLNETNTISEQNPLVDIHVSIENIEPCNRDPVSLVDERGLSVMLRFGSIDKYDDLIVAVITTSSTNKQSVSKILFRIVPANSVKTKLQAPSATSLPPYNPFIPTLITQILLISKSSLPLNQESIKFRLDYTIDSTNHKATGKFDIALS